MPSQIYFHRHGETLTPIREKDRLELLKLPENKPLRANITKPRNPKVHRLYFAAIAAAAKHWPEDAEPLDLNQDEAMLRAFLQVKSGYFTRKIFDLSAKDQLIELIADIRGEGKFAFVKQTIFNKEPCVAVFTPLSIRYEELGDEEFRPLKESVFEIILSTLNIGSITELVAAAENEV